MIARTMRAIAVGAMVGAAAAIFAAPAAARRTAVIAQVSARGSIAITWHGDRARGCAEAGLCRYRGALFTRPGGDGLFLLTVAGGRVRDSFGYVYFQEPPTVRVERDAERACVDLAPARDVIVFADRVERGRVRLRLAPYGLSAGRCAGPDASAMIDRLPHPTVSLARLRRGDVTVPFTGRARYSIGHYSGVVSSTMRLHLGRSEPELISEESEPEGPSTGRRIRFVRVQAVYRATGLIGKLATTFHGSPEPFCAALDTCGTVGDASWAILSIAGGTVVVEGEAPARETDNGVRGGVAALQRGSGVAYAIGSFRHALGTTAARVRGSDGATCHDHVTAPAPGFDTRESHTGIPLRLGGIEAFPPGADLLRTGCPGPLQADVTGDRAFATRTLPTAALLRRRLSVTLAGGGRYKSPGYVGRSTARFSLGLRRVALRAFYRHVRVGR